MLRGGGEEALPPCSSLWGPPPPHPHQAAVQQGMRASPVWRGGRAGGRAGSFSTPPSSMARTPGGPSLKKPDCSALILLHLRTSLAAFRNPWNLKLSSQGGAAPKLPQRAPGMHRAHQETCLSPRKDVCAAPASPPSLLGDAPHTLPCGLCCSCLISCQIVIL